MKSHGNIRGNAPLETLILRAEKIKEFVTIKIILGLVIIVDIGNLISVKQIQKIRKLNLVRQE